MHGPWVPSISAKGPHRCSPAGNPSAVSVAPRVAQTRSAVVSSHQTHLLARDDPTDRELVQLLGQLDDLLERLGAAESTWSDWLAAVDPVIAPAPEISCITGQFGRQTCASCRADWPHSGCRRWVVANPTSRPHCESSAPRWLQSWRTRGIHPRRPPSARRRVASCCGAGPSTYSGRRRPTGRPASWSPCRQRPRRTPIWFAAWCSAA